jgi:hypothetical protein
VNSSTRVPCPIQRCLELIKTDDAEPSLRRRSVPSSRDRRACFSFLTVINVVSFVAHNGNDSGKSQRSKKNCKSCVWAA